MSVHPLAVGEYYRLSIGQAEILDFYEEDEVQKVRVCLRPYQSSDGKTVQAGEGSLFSMPVERFLALMADYDADQVLRQRLAEQRTRRRAPL